MSVKRSAHLLPSKERIFRFFKTRNYHKQSDFVDKYADSPEFKIDGRLISHMAELRTWNMYHAPTEYMGLQRMQELNKLQNEHAYIEYRGTPPSFSHPQPNGE